MINDDRTSANECEAIEELIPNYAFGLTSAEETRRVEAHLDACPNATRQLADFRRMQAEMRESVAQIEPPPQMMSRLMTAIAVTEVPKPEAPKAAPRRPRFGWAWIAAAAFVIALVATNVYWMTRVNDLIQRQDELTALIRGQGQDTNAFVLTSTADLRWVRLPSQVNDESSAFLMWNAESEIGLAYMRGFPQLTPGQTYQLWLTRGETRVSAGTFQVDEEGNAALLFNSREPIDDYTWSRITVEPADGSQTPSDTIVVNGEL